MSPQNLTNLIAGKVEKSRMLGDFRKTEGTKCGTRSSFSFYSETRATLPQILIQSLVHV